MISQDVIQIPVVSLDRPTQSLAAESVYKLLPQEGYWRCTLHMDNSCIHSTHDRKLMEAGLQLGGKRFSPDAWPRGYFEDALQYDNKSRLTVAVHDANLNAAQYMAVIETWLDRGYSVLPIVIYTGEYYEGPCHAELCRGLRCRGELDHGLMIRIINDWKAGHPLSDNTLGYGPWVERRG